MIIMIMRTTDGKQMVFFHTEIKGQTQKPGRNESDDLRSGLHAQRWSSVNDFLTREKNKFTSCKYGPEKTL